MKAIGYCRVSSDEQAQKGISIEAQTAILDGCAAMNQVDDWHVITDPGFSGKDLRRPGIQKLLAECRAGDVDKVMVWKLDRLSRSLRDTLDIIEDIFKPNSITLISVTESIDTSTPSGRMMLNLLASFAQLEREQDSDRVVMAQKHLANDCKYLGGHVPLGYKIDSDRHYILDPKASPVIRKAFEMYMSREGYTAILAHINEHLHLFPQKKKPLSKSDLNYLLGNEIYAGTYTHAFGKDKRSTVTNAETVRIPGGVPAIVTPDEWERIQSIRAENTTTAAKYGAKRTYLLSGLVYCGVCDKLVPVDYGGKDRDGTPQRYYTCHNKCIKPVRVERLDESVLAFLRSMLDESGIL